MENVFGWAHKADAGPGELTYQLHHTSNTALFLGFCFLTNPTKMPLMKWASLLGSLPTIIAARGLLSYIQVASSLDSAGLGSVQENHCHHGWISMIPFSLTTLQRDPNGRMKHICVSQIQLCPIWSLFGHTIMFSGRTV